MNERQEGAPKFYDFSVELRKFTTNDLSMRLNKLTQSDGRSPVIAEAVRGTWESGAMRTDDRLSITALKVGLDENPEHEKQLFAWGTRSQNDEILIKTAHEVAHAYQVDERIEQGIVDFLNNKNEGFTDKQMAAIECYAMLSGTGRLSGLSTLGIYEAQSAHAGDLKIEILEDMTELLGAYLISDEYFSWRLSNTRIPLGEEHQAKIASYIIRMCPIS